MLCLCCNTRSIYRYSNILGKLLTQLTRWPLHIIKYSIFINFPLTTMAMAKLKPKQRHAIAKCNWWEPAFVFIICWDFGQKSSMAKKKRFPYWVFCGRKDSFFGSEFKWRKFSIKTFAVFQFSHFQDKSTKLFYTETKGEGNGWSSEIAFGFGLWFCNYFLPSSCFLIPSLYLKLCMFYSPAVAVVSWQLQLLFFILYFDHHFIFLFYFFFVLLLLLLLLLDFSLWQMEAHLKWEKINGQHKI